MNKNDLVDTLIEEHDLTRTFARNAGPERRRNATFSPALAKITPPEQALPPVRLTATVIQIPLHWPFW